MGQKLKQQPIFYPGSGLAFRTVYDIRTWDGRTIGTVKVGHGARMVVQRVQTEGGPNPRHRWDILAGLSIEDTGGVRDGLK